MKKLGKKKPLALRVASYDTIAVSVIRLLIVCMISVTVAPDHLKVNDHESVSPISKMVLS